MNCLLRNALGSGDEVSKASYQTVLAEVDAPHKTWFLGNYEILEQIGCGGMGVIYRARQRHSQRIVAVKRVLSYRADSHGALQRFRREAQAVASLDHPNILPIYEVSESEDGLPFFSMKLAEKGSLLENTPPLGKQPRKCVELMAKVARAVEYAHSRGVLHRDLKPGNILLDDRGEPLVSDFGLAKLLDGSHDLTRSVTTFGTAGFIAPEQANDSAADLTPAADVYSLGAVLFNLLAGRPPFLGSNPISVIRKASETQAPKLRSVAPSLDRDLETICARCLERDPKARYQSAGDLAAELERWLGGHPIVARPVSPPARMWRWSQRNPKLVGAATAGLLLGATAVWFFRGAPQSGNGLDKRLSEVASNTSRATGVGNIGNSAPVVVPFNAPSAPDYTFPAHLEDRASTRVVAALPETESISAEPDRAPEKITTRDELATEVPPAPMQTAAKTSGRDRSPHLAVATKKIVADVTAAPAEERPNSNARDRSSVVAMRAKKIPPQVSTGSPEPRLNIGARDRSSEEATPKTKIGSTGPASIQGFVKDSKGEPIKGADLRIESRDGKQVFRTVRTDPTGRYSSPGLQPGVYRVTLVVNGAVKASITNTQAKENQPTQLNFDFKGTTQTSTAATTGRKHMVWVPNRTGSHIGGTWVEVDDKGTGHAESNMQTYTTRQ